MSLTDRRIVITGGGTGIGLATAKFAATRGASVVLMGRREAKLQAAAESIGAAASYHVLDVTDDEALKKGMEVKSIEFMKQGAEIYQRQ